MVDYETAVVLGVEPQSARVFFADRGEQTIGFDAMSWAAPFVNDDAVGTKPTSVTEVLKVGDIVRFRQDSAGHWRLAQIPEVEGAFASVDPLDGGLVALTGGFDFFLSNYNRATQAKRQPGSAFKPFVYSAALQNGFTPATIVNDSPPEGEYQAELERVWRPENFNNEYFGFVSLRFALQHSLNAVSIRITKAMGVPTAVRYARKFGFDDTAIPNNLSIALGAGGVAPLDLVTAYAAFANGGYRVDHYFIQRIASSTGEVVYEARPAFVCPDCGQPTPTAVPNSCSKPAAALPSAKPDAASSDVDVTNLNAVAPQVITPQNAYLMTDLLKDVVCGRHRREGAHGVPRPYRSRGQDRHDERRPRHVVRRLQLRHRRRRPGSASIKTARSAARSRAAARRFQCGSITCARRSRTSPRIRLRVRSASSSTGSIRAAG